MEIVTPEFYLTYINLVKAESVQEALSENTLLITSFLQQVPPGKTDYAYAEGKWTIKQVLQHLTDTERVFSYRALWFARKDSHPLPPFNQNEWAVTANVWRRSWEDMTTEFQYVRKATEMLFASFDGDTLAATGTVNNNLLNVAALGYICAGHVQHHVAVMQERYLNK